MAKPGHVMPHDEVDTERNDHRAVKSSEMAERDLNGRLIFVNAGCRLWERQPCAVTHG